MSGAIGSSNNPIDLSSSRHITSKELNIAAKGVANKRSEFLFVKNEEKTLKLQIQKTHWWSNPKVVNAELMGRDSQASTSLEMQCIKDAFKGIRLGASHGAGNLQAAAKEAAQKGLNILSKNFISKRLTEDDWGQVKQYIEAGANVNTMHTTQSGVTFLHKAAELNNLEMVKYLVECGANINLAKEGQDSPLQLAIRTCNKPEGQAIINYLLEQPGVELNRIGGGHETPLMTAVIIANKEIINKLINVRADVNINLNIKNQEGKTSLHIAATKGDEEMMEMLIKAGADVSITNAQKMTAAQVLTQRKEMGNDRKLINEIHKIFFGELTEKEIGERNCIKAITPEEIETLKEKISQIKHLINFEYGENITLLQNAVQYGDQELVKYFIGRGADINQINERGVSSVLPAIRNGNQEMVEYLINNNLLTSKCIIDECMHAVIDRNLVMFQFLLEKVEDVNQVCYNHHSLLDAVQKELRETQGKLKQTPESEKLKQEKEILEKMEKMLAEKIQQNQKQTQA
ncbi:MAG: ankyrin repeat domain-containing protein [Puniceicoccales bacterium]|jgi:ankyrin repeat protein|nr:ankyrin repeat domain-containing protein [Puniceicoccales bacterium]